MKIATWNVNSIRARCDLLLGWLKADAPDIVLLQETKVTDQDFPTLDFQMLGYGVAMAGQRTYNGVAILSRHPITEVEVGLLGDGPEADKRWLSATVLGLRVASAYVPNGKSVDSPSFPEKLAWLGRLRQTLDERVPKGTPFVLGGDFNIAADERDVYDPVRLRGQLHFHPREHEALKQVTDYGLVDAFRLHHQEGGLYSWWDYRGPSLRLNRGLRIDYLFLSQELASRCTGATMLRELRDKPKPSDHVPVVATLSP